MTAVTDRMLDWTINLDPRSLPYKIDRTVKVLKARNRIWKRDTWLDQGREGACVGFSCGHAMATTPRRWRPQVDALLARALYQEAKERDEWVGVDYEGSSVNGGMKALRDRSLVKRWLWATTMPELIHAVGYIGPVVIGVDWYQGMLDTDSRGFIHKTGRMVGGHAILLGGVAITARDEEGKATDGAFLLYNSWGKDWGVNGAAWISSADLASLMDDGGEFAVLTKAQVPAAL